MVNPQFIEEQPVTLVDVQVLLNEMQKRDEELNYLSNKTKEFVDNFVTIPLEKKEELYKKLHDLNLTRLKEEHIMKIIDFLPTTTADLKIVFQAYPLSLPKKDQEAIVGAVKAV
ncbi:hypothetical protein HOI26_04330 [Candidatus Woesearchaeota archaeon]|jgi:DNA-directed RNA polymerase subunit F|nr:hypothetical protein [Candidatus Woesearchaeota archaeon]MBT5740302.1 hypothetical protein [Candidatus Woesearchaeota archaeon]